MRYVAFDARQPPRHIRRLATARRCWPACLPGGRAAGRVSFGVSAQFITNSIDSWFGNDTQEALERSLNLSKSALNLSLCGQHGAPRHRQIELISAASLGNDLAAALPQSPAPLNSANLALYNLNNGRTEAERNPQRLPAPSPTNTPWSLLNRLPVRSIESINVRRAQGWLMLNDQNAQQTALFFRQPIPANAKDASLIEAVASGPRRIELRPARPAHLFSGHFAGRHPAGDYAMALVWALYSARRFVEPILSLAGARAVAQR